MTVARYFAGGFDVLAKGGYSVTQTNSNMGCPPIPAKISDGTHRVVIPAATTTEDKFPIYVVGKRNITPKDNAWRSMVGHFLHCGWSCISNIRIGVYL